MKVYRLYVAKPLLILYLLMILSWPLVGAAGLVGAIFGAFGPDRTVVWIFVIVLGIGLLISYMWLRYPFEIRVNDGMAEFRSVVRKTVVPVAEIKSVRAPRYTIGFVDVQYERGTVHLINQMDGFHDFVSTVKSLNPAARIEGC
jgi:uncharacterized membrane protein